MASSSPAVNSSAVRSLIRKLPVPVFIFTGFGIMERAGFSVLPERKNVNVRRPISIIFFSIKRIVFNGQTYGFFWNRG
jgi:hypothetical protein